MRKDKKKVAVAMSGGVDSSAAALILKREGYDVVGISMKLWDVDDGRKKSCCSLEDFHDARRVAHKIGIPYYVVNMKKEFSERVIERFVSLYLGGETPNPCILCNEEMKFDLLLKKAEEVGVDFLATGHYARILYDGKRGRYILKKGVDGSKDQSYFLYSMTQAQMSKVLFPLGSYKKSRVRKIMKQAGIHIADKGESQDICFVDHNGYPAFIDRLASKEKIRKGRIVSETGRVLGRHEGIHRFTVGQRRGLGISSDKRLYVLGFDSENGDVVVGDSESLLAGGLIAKQVNWISFDVLKERKNVATKIRYSGRGSESTIYCNEDDNRVKVIFHSPQRAVTPGQAVVFYDDDEMLGGGWIERALN